MEPAWRGERGLGIRLGRPRAGRVAGRRALTRAAVLLLAAVATLAGCGSQGGEQGGGQGGGQSGGQSGGNDNPDGRGIANQIAARPVSVVTTVGMITDIVVNIGGERVAVTALMGPGIDPHLYKASARDVIRMQEADVVFYGGLHLEGAMTRAFERMTGRVRAVAVAEAIDPARLLGELNNPSVHDPHVWFDVSLWMVAAERVGAVLEEVDPQHAPGYHDRTAAYLERLRKLDAYVKDRAAELTPERRVLITAHDAFRYFSRAYGFEVRGLQGISTVTEAGTSDLRELADFIAARRVPAVFVESSVPRRAIEALQAAVAARGYTVAIGGELLSDAMGDPGTPAGTYEGMVRHNIDTIVDALAAAGGQ